LQAISRDRVLLHLKTHRRGACVLCTAVTKKLSYESQIFASYC
jgi:hypothetical protein